MRGSIEVQSRGPPGRIMKKCSVNGWTPIFASARSKNFGSLDDINESLNIAENDYSVNQAVSC